MTPSLSVPTDNIYKFASLFGLALIIVSVLFFVTTYTSALGTKTRHSELIIALNSKDIRSKHEEDLLQWNQQLLNIAIANEKAANYAVGAICGLGIVVGVWGLVRWRYTVQKRDDRLADLQLRKLELEVAQLAEQVEPDREDRAPQAG